MLQSQIGTIYTIGYADPTAAARVDQLMHDERMLLLDVRLSPRSRWQPAWNRHALAATYGPRYQWDGRLGNLNHRERARGIELAPGHLNAAHDAATLLLQGTSLIVLCACKDARTCHRTLVAKLIQDALIERSVVCR